ncbi:MAG: hypothetical protein ACRDGN_07795 [bacterium]
MWPLGSYLLSRRLSIGLAEREIVIQRVCARCGCDYEWGVHASIFATRAGLSEASRTEATPPPGGPPHNRVQRRFAVWVDLYVAEKLRALENERLGRNPLVALPEINSRRVPGSAWLALTARSLRRLGEGLEKWATVSKAI